MLKEKVTNLISNVISSYCKSLKPACSSSSSHHGLGETVFQIYSNTSPVFILFLFIYLFMELVNLFIFGLPMF